MFSRALRKLSRKKYQIFDKKMPKKLISIEKSVRIGVKSKEIQAKNNLSNLLTKNRFYDKKFSHILVLIIFIDKIYIELY